MMQLSVALDVDMVAPVSLQTDVAASLDGLGAIAKLVCSRPIAV